MRVIESRNVNSNYLAGMDLLQREGERSKSRVGEVLVMDTPVVTVTHRPMERVLFCRQRNANPFFHFFESLWMLAGRRDVTWLDRFVGDFSKRFGEETGYGWGAYGFRWRHHFQFDQLDRVVEKLRADHLDRRVVISMWDPQSDLDLAGIPEGAPPPKDLPCNTHIYLRIRGVHHEEEIVPTLDLTVCVRSNDIIWGAYGANAVHFSFLQEYLAGRIGVAVGRMYQVSNNWHGYTDVMHKMGIPDAWDPYSEGVVVPAPIGDRWDDWDADCEMFLSAPAGDMVYKNSWFNRVARPMYIAHANAKSKDWNAARYAARAVQADDWSLAAVQWIERKMNNAQ